MFLDKSEMYKQTLLNGSAYSHPPGKLMLNELIHCLKGQFLRWEPSPQTEAQTEAQSSVSEQIRSRESL